MIYSFDIFDTILTRVVANPIDIFYLIGKDAVEKGLWTKTIEEFKTTRINVELQSRIGKENSETTFEEIYLTLQKETKLDKNIINQISDIELAREEWAIRPIGVMYEEIEKARQKSRNELIFLSDMYLPSYFLKKLLIKFGFYKEKDLVIVSCEQNAAKHNGTLYKKLKHDLQISGKWVHVGNNYESDFLRAKKEGIEAKYFNQGNLNRYELILVDGNSIEYSLFAGISRITRLKNIYKSKQETISNTTASVAAPCLVSYTIWCLQKAKELNIEKLYFASRDGEVLLDIAKIIAPYLNSTCELEYFYGGRHVWHNALVPHSNDYPNGFLNFKLSKNSTVASELERFGIKKSEDIFDIIQENGFSRKKNLLNSSNIYKFIKIINDEKVKKSIKNYNTKDSILALKYLQTKEIQSEKRKAIIDLGWGGNVLDSLNKFINLNYKTKIYGFYWGLEKKRENSYCFTTEGNKHYWQLEMFCAGLHGTVLGFQDQNNIITPKLSSSENVKVIKWGLNSYRKSIIDFSNEFTPIINEIKSLDFNSFSSLMDVFTNYPTLNEAKVWGEFPYEEDQTGKYVIKIAPILNLKEVFHYIIHGRKSLNSVENKWPEARYKRFVGLFEKFKFIRSI